MFASMGGRSWLAATVAVVCVMSSPSAVAQTAGESWTVYVVNTWGDTNPTTGSVTPIAVTTNTPGTPIPVGQQSVPRRRHP